MATYNNFGATVSEVVASYPGIAVDDLGGTAVAQAVVDRAARTVLAALPESVHRILTDKVSLEVVSSSGRPGTVFKLGVSPVVDGSVYLFRSDGRPNVRPVIDSVYEDTNFTQVDQTITLATALLDTEWLMATYRIDPTDASFAWPSVADIVVWCAAAEIGARLFISSPDGGMELVTTYRDKCEASLKALAAGEWIPEEVRSLGFYDDIAPSDGGMSGFGSVPIRRA